MSKKRKGTWGGRREGAGRKPTPGKLEPAHRVRPQHDPRHPVHVVLRTVPEIGRSLRLKKVHAAVREAVDARAVTVTGKGKGKAAFRVVHVSVQDGRVDLVVEAGSTDALSDGMRVQSIAVARAINGALARSGKVFAFRYQATALTTRAAVKAALAAG